MSSAPEEFVCSHSGKKYKYKRNLTSCKKIHRVPLKSIKVDVHITGYVAEVSSSLTYYNEETDPVEATFTFPVDDGSAVFQFEGDIDGRHIVAEIQEKEQAVLTYKDAVDHGKTAMLLKEDNSAGDIFSCMLGNLPPESEAVLVMKYVIDLPQEPDGKLRFTLPTILNPRYSPDAGSLEAAKGATYIPPCKVPYEFSMSLTVQGYHKVTSITSDKIKLDVDFQDNNKTAKVAIGDDFKFDHDLCLLVEYEQSFTPQVVLEDGNPEAEGLLKEDILMFSFHPDLKEVAMATSGEYIFVIDRSGSMMGSDIKNAKEALFLFLKSLPPECYFNIISFGHTFSALFTSGSKKYSEDSMKTANDLLHKMDADMGGTEIYKPLKHVFDKKLIQGHPRRVFVLTDGGVANTNEVIGLVKKYSQSTNTRVFSFGIGNGASTALIKGIANNGGGKAVFVTEEERVQPKVISLLKCAMQSAVTDISIKWDLPPDVTPVSIPTEPPVILYPGERLTLFAILKGVDKFTAYAQSTVTLDGRRDCETVSYNMTFTLSEVDDISTSAPVHRLATKAQIKILQDEESALLNQDITYGLWDKTSNVHSLRKKVIDLSRHGNIISKYTAFIAIDTEGKRVEDKSMERSCPVPTLSDEFQNGLQNSTTYMLRGCGLGMDVLDGQANFVKTSSRKRKPSSGLLGCGPNLSKLFSRKSRKSSSPKFKQCSSAKFKPSIPDPVPLDVDVADCFDKLVEEHIKVHGVEEDSFKSAGINVDEYMEGVKATVNSLDEVMSEEVDDELVDLTIEDEDSPVMVPGVGNPEITPSAAPDACDSNISTSPTKSKGKDLAKTEIETDASTRTKAVSTPAVRPGDMLSVIRLQELHGQWNVSGQLLQLLGVQAEEMDKLDFSQDSSVVCTVVVLGWLRKHFADRQDEWQMIETKALVWLSFKELLKSVENIIKETTRAVWPE